MTKHPYKGTYTIVVVGKQEDYTCVHVRGVFTTKLKALEALEYLNKQLEEGVKNYKSIHYEIVWSPRINAMCDWYDAIVDFNDEE